MSAVPRVDWDYAALAAHYDRRAPYDARLFLHLASVLPLAGARIADIGAGTGRLSAGLARAGAIVDAVEPCAEMRAVGEHNCSGLPVHWHDALGEATGLPAGKHLAVSFGSSFNVLAPMRALAEAERLLAADGALVVVYNHRQLDDPLQAAIEATIRARVPDFDHGSRRQDPSPQLEAGGRFRVVEQAAWPFGHRLPAAAFVDGFRAHATLQRQAGAQFERVLAEIEQCVQAAADADGIVEVPFATRCWLARRA